MTHEQMPQDRPARRLHRRVGTAAVAVLALLAAVVVIRPSLDQGGPVRRSAALPPATPACNFGSGDGGGHQLAIPLGRTLRDVSRRGGYADAALVVAEVGPAKAARYSYAAARRPANGPAEPTVTPYVIIVLDRLGGLLNPSEAVLSGGQVGSCGQPVTPPPGLARGRTALLVLSPPRFRGATYQAEIREVLPIQNDQVFAYQGFWLTTDVPGPKRPGTYPGYDPGHHPGQGSWIPLSSIRALACR